MNSFKKTLIFVLFLAVTLVSCKTNETKKDAEKTSEKNGKHNVLFISIDDLRTKINSYGELKMITPNIDKLAFEGLQFNQAYTNIAVCGASRASIMTGIRPSETRFNDFSSRASKDTPNAKPLNQIFQEFIDNKEKLELVNTDDSNYVLKLNDQRIFLMQVEGKWFLIDLFEVNNLISY